VDNEVPKLHQDILSSVANWTTGDEPTLWALVGVDDLEGYIEFCKEEVEQSGNEDITASEEIPAVEKMIAFMAEHQLDLIVCHDLIL